MRKNQAFLLVVFSFFSHFSAFSQLLQVKNGFQNDIVKVVTDYDNQFKNLRGEEIIQHPQSVDYRSLLSIPGAEECIVSKYSAKDKEIYSWQATMLKTEDFEEASKKFKSLYNSLQNLSVAVGGQQLVFKAKYEKPVEEMKFTSIVFKAGKEDQPSKVRIELTLQVEMLDWVVKVLVYDVEWEDHEVR